MLAFYDDLVVFLKRPFVVDPFRVVDLMCEATVNENIAIEVKEYAYVLLSQLKQTARQYEPKNAVQRILKTQILASRSWAMVNTLVKPLIIKGYEDSIATGQPMNEDSALLGEEFDALFRLALHNVNNKEENLKQSIALRDQEFMHLTHNLTDSMTRFVGKMGREEALKCMKAVVRRMGFEARNLTFIEDSPF